MTVTRSKWTLSKSEVTADAGLVVAGKELAAEAGVEMLRQGGNAVDAAVATGWAIGVVEPWMNGIGGTGAMVVHFEGAQVATEFGARAPLGARPDMYSVDYSRGPAGQFGWPPIEDLENEIGYRSVAVPGLVAGLCGIHRRFGKLPLSIVMEPAIRLADLGYDVDWHSALLIGIHLPHLLRFRETASVFLRDGAYPPVPTIPPGRADRIVQRDLAESLRHIARHGADGYYRGDLAAAIAEHMSANGGLVSREDLAAYEPRIFEGALHGSYRGFEVFGVPGATGGPMLLEILNVLEGQDIRGLGSASVPTLHILAEACRRAYEDHFQFAVDGGAVQGPWDGLVSKDYAAAIRSEIRPEATRGELAPVDPWSFPLERPAHTTHLCAVDADRNAVSITQTLGGLFGSTVTIPGTGILLNDMMLIFDPRPGHLNSIEGGKSQAAPYTPAVLLRDGRLKAVVGAPGGRRIPTAIAQVISNLIDHRMGIQDAIAAPRLHAESRTVEIDERFGAETVAALQQLGHPVAVQEKTVCSFNFANPVGIAVNEDGGLAGGTDPCLPGAAVGFGASTQ